ncbi:hypothetical protein [Rhizobium sp. SSA_523]|uniref:hypothetical protein n=1 Tax=Rhizobium sp. SSA_523 TaxID=2952477 RepID=UPI002090D8FB|nr:hypothetical protein [Rhizobium sp. SSA_523]MCO5731892.1 hypothetical protein [Rhizobium sp. SSA_523]WKC22752.1 hypothetical protein QTJ18_18070 [Rhizobium sp. SSA_523]
MKQHYSILATAFLCLGASFAQAEPAKPDAKSLVSPELVKNIQSFIGSDIVRLSVEAQNTRLKDLKQEEIDQLDKQWRAERESADKPLIAATLSSPLSVYLSRIQGRSLGLYAEIFVMDRNGLNVGQSSVTSDFWQGDEDKFQKTFDVSGDAMFIDEPEWDKDARIWRGQVSFTVVDPQTKAAIGAVTVELNLTELARRQSPGA